MKRAALILLPMLAACGSREAPNFLADASPDRGRDRIVAYGCTACHAIPGTHTAQGTVGPPLGTMSRQAYIAGVLPHTPENLVRWIQSPQKVVPGTGMPDQGLSEQESRDIVAYLYSIGGGAE